MIIAAISDLHGFLPEIPQCDVALIAGDVCPATDHSVSFQQRWLTEDFARWLKGIPARRIFVIGGNHDFALESHGYEISDFWPGKVSYLEGSEEEFEGKWFGGFPWTLPFCKWAFMAPEATLRDRLEEMRGDLDVLISHGPPRYYADKAPNGTMCGSLALYGHLVFDQPKLCVFGHIHNCQGQKHRLGDTLLANVAYVDEQYKPFQPPMTFEI